MSDTKTTAENALAEKYPAPSGLDRRAVRLAAHLTHHGYSVAEATDLLGLTAATLGRIRATAAYKSELQRLERSKK